MENETLRNKLKYHKISGLRLAKHFGISRQQVYSWLNYGLGKKGANHKIGKAWSRLLEQYFEDLGK